MAIKKKTFAELKKENSSSTQYKPQEFLDCGPAFESVTGMKGPAIGHINMFIGHSNSGKAQPLSSKILTPNGWVKMGNLKIGSTIIGQNGKNQKVLSIYPQGVRPIYEVITSDNGRVLCDEEHLWSVRDTCDSLSDNRFKTINTGNMLGNLSYKLGNSFFNNYELPIVQPVEFVETGYLPIDPYVLGCLIGKGFFENEDIFINTDKNDILKKISTTNHFDKIHNDMINTDNNLKYKCVQLTSGTKRMLSYLGYNEIKSDSVFIPEEYIYNASINDRVALLQGLMDMNGLCTLNGRVKFVTESEKMKSDFIILVNSLGGITSDDNEKAETPIDQCNEHSLILNIPEEFDFFTSSDKKEWANKTRRPVRRYIREINFFGNEECQCIKVSNEDSLYVTDDFIVTHNTTALILAAIDCQKKGIIPVFLITEQKWDWEHLKLMGFKCEQNTKTGEWEGDFYFKNDFRWIEEVTDYMNHILNQQASGESPFSFCFFWDSVGSIPCQMTYDGKGGKQHTAGVLQDKIGMGLNQRVTGSRSITNPYTNTLVVINQPWVERPASPMGQPKIKPKGGNAIYLNATLVFLFGNEAASGVSKFDATLNGRKIAWGSRTKIGVDKNHVNGLGFKDGQIVVTPHGFLLNDKVQIDEYKKNNKNYWSKLFNTIEIEGMVIDTDGVVIDEDVDYEG